MKKLMMATVLAAAMAAVQAVQAAGASFADFDARAKAGEPMSVVYLGASLTYSANASDPGTTGFRGLMSDYLLKRYPKTQFRFHDAAIGGTPSRLGLFRLERDVLSKKPDLVFLDFLCNDGGDNVNPENTCAYEQIIRTLVEKGIAVEQLHFTFRWWAEGDANYLRRVPRQQLYANLGAYYSTPCADTWGVLKPLLDAKKTTFDQVWPVDGGHPADYGYTLFFESARLAFEKAVADKLVCECPAEPLYGSVSDVRRLALAGEKLPAGWKTEIPFRNSLWFDGLSSRWMGDVAVATGASAAFETKAPCNYVGLFGEADDNAALMAELTVDGKATKHAFWCGAGGRLFVFRDSFLGDWQKGEGAERAIALKALADEKKPNGQLRVESILTATFKPTAKGLEIAKNYGRKDFNLDAIDHARGQKK